MSFVDNTEKGPANPNMDDSKIAPESEIDVESGPDNVETSAEEKDPNVVDWDGPTDLENPMNWPDSKKWLNISILSIMTLVT